VFNFQAGVGILNPSDMNSLHGQGSMDTSDQEQGPASQDTLDGLDGKRLFSLSHYLKHFLLILLYCISELSSTSTKVIDAVIPVLWVLSTTGVNKKMVT
jgi:hypothetical protein